MSTDFRDQYLDFTSSIHERKYYAIFREPDQTVDIFASQFSTGVWITLVIMVLILQLAMLIMNILVGKIEKAQTKEQGSSKKKIMPMGPEDRFETIDVLGWSFGKYIFVLYVV